MVNAPVSELEPLSTMVANAATSQVKPALDLTEQDLDIACYGSEDKSMGKIFPGTTACLLDSKRLSDMNS